MMNMRSTQRAESVHSAVSGFLTKSTLLTALVTKLDEYNFDVTRRAETRTFKHVRSLDAAAANCNSHFLVTAVRPTHLIRLHARLRTLNQFSPPPA